jgi:hypothetical protein
MSKFEYKKVPVQDDVAIEAQNYQNQGWETVGVFREGPVISGYVSQTKTLHLLLKRELPVEYEYKMVNITFGMTAADNIENGVYQWANSGWEFLQAFSNLSGADYILMRRIKPENGEDRGHKLATIPGPK